MKPLKNITTSLSSVVLFCRTIDRTAGFYTEVLGLKVIRQSETFAELKDAHSLRIMLRKATSQSLMSRGYSPVLNFAVQNFDSVCQKVTRYNLPFDGEIINTQEVQIATFRGIDGEMISIVRQQEEVEEEKSPQDAETEQIKRILKKIRL